MEEGQSPSASFAHNSSGSNVSPFPRPTVPRPTAAREASNQAMASFFGAPQAPAAATTAAAAAAAAAAITPRALAEPRAAAVRAAEVAAVPAPAPAEAPLAATVAATAPADALTAAPPVPCNRDSLSKGTRRTDGCRQHERQALVHLNTPCSPPLRDKRKASMEWSCWHLEVACLHLKCWTIYLLHLPVIPIPSCERA